MTFDDNTKAFPPLSLCVVLIFLSQPFHLPEQIMPISLPTGPISPGNCGPAPSRPPAMVPGRGILVARPDGNPGHTAPKCKVIRQGSHREVICLQLLALKNPKNLVKAMNTEKKAFWRHTGVGSQGSQLYVSLQSSSRHGRLRHQVFIECFDKAFISYKTSC